MYSYSNCGVLIFSVTCQGMRCCLCDTVKSWLLKCLKTFLSWSDFSVAPFLWNTSSHYCETSRKTFSFSHLIALCHKWFLTVQLKLSDFCVLVLEKSLKQLWDKTSIYCVGMKKLTKKIAKNIGGLAKFSFFGSNQKKVMKTIWYEVGKLY